MQHVYFHVSSASASGAVAVDARCMHIVLSGSTRQDITTEVDKKRTRLTFEPSTQLGGGGVSSLNFCSD